MGRPNAALTLRVALGLIPLTLSVVAARIFDRVFPDRLGLSRFAWWFVLSLVATAVLLAVDKSARRLVPLSVLLRMTLIFPDQAPSRFRVALRSTNTTRLKKHIADLQSGTLQVDDSSQAAALMLELVAALSMHDRLTRGHCERVRAYTELVMAELDFSEEEASYLRWSALLHDIGKLMVPASILQKEGKLTEAEWRTIKSHPAEGERLTRPLATWLGEWRNAVLQHHERFDGSGYPQGLAGRNIHLAARIVAVTDAYDVMTSTRSYKKPMPPRDARIELARCAGSHFDPVIVRAFLNVSLGRLRFALGPLSWLANVPGAGPVGLASTTTGGLTAGLAAASAVLLTPVAWDVQPSARVEAAAFATPSSDAVSTTLTITTSSNDTVTASSGPATTAPATIAPGGPASTAPASTSSPTSSAAPTTARGASSTTAAGSTSTVATTTSSTLPGAPVLQPLNAASMEDSVTVLNVTGSGAGALSLSIPTPPANGSVTLGEVLTRVLPQSATPFSKTISYAPRENFNGTDSFVVRLCDSRSRCAQQQVVVSVQAVNDPPTPSEDLLELDAYVGTVINAATLLGNDADVDGDELYIVSVSSATRGVTGLTGSSVHYRGPTNFAGEDSFTYVVADSAGATATGTVRVALNNRLPVTAYDVRSVRRNSTGTPLHLLFNDFDPDGGSLTVTSVAVSIGSAFQAGGLWKYTPPSNYAGVATGSYVVIDEEGGTAVEEVQDLRRFPRRFPHYFGADGELAACRGRHCSGQRLVHTRLDVDRHRYRSSLLLHRRRLRRRRVSLGVLLPVS